MVKFVVVSQYNSQPPRLAERGRIKITGGPLYPLAEVQRLLNSGGAPVFWTEKARTDAGKWFSHDVEYMAQLLASLEEADYIDSEWCTNGKGALAACDAYRLCSVIEEAPATGQPVRMDYYFKFAVAAAGAVILMVSCHA